MKDKGFTLIELLIAILIFSIIMGTLFSSFQAFLISSEKVKQDLSQSEKIKNVLHRIRLDLESIYIAQPPEYKKPAFNTEPDPYRFIGEIENMGSISASSMIFASSAHAVIGADKREGIARISYYLKENQNNGYDLYRSDSLLPFYEEPDTCFDFIVCKDIVAFEISYQDGNNDSYTYWDSDSREFHYTFPESIFLKIVFAAKENTQDSTTGSTTGSTTAFTTAFDLISQRSYQSNN